MQLRVDAKDTGMARECVGAGGVGGEGMVRAGVGGDRGRVMGRA